MRGMDFDTTRRDARIFRAGRPQLHLTGDGHDPLIPERIRRRVRCLRGRRIDDHLNEAGSISYIKEDEATVVTPTVNPAGKAHDLTRLGRREFSAIM